MCRGCRLVSSCGAEQPLTRTRSPPKDKPACAGAEATAWREGKRRKMKSHAPRVGGPLTRARQGALPLQRGGPEPLVRAPSLGGLSRDWRPGA